MTRAITRTELGRPGRIAAAMMAAGLAIGFVGGQLAPDIAGALWRPAPVRVEVAQAPSLTPVDDYGIRHLQAPALTLRDDFATRHAGTTALTSSDDYANRHP
jgi:hypothetical protein